MPSVIDDTKLFKDSEAQDVQEVSSYDQSSRPRTGEDVFSDEDSHEIHYKTLSWQVKRLPTVHYVTYPV